MDCEINRNEAEWNRLEEYRLALMRRVEVVERLMEWREEGIGLDQAVDVERDTGPVPTRRVDAAMLDFFVWSTGQSPSQNASGAEDHGR